MIIAKFGGSLIAPKNRVKFIDDDYLRQIAPIRNGINDSKFFVHGAGNIGHGFIKKYGLTHETYLTGRVIIEGLTNTIDGFIDGIRLYPEELQFVTDTTKGSFICGGDIVPDLSISSGDDQFPQLINQTHSNTGYIFTDVDGVLDNQNNIIETISKENIDQISFWNVENDVTGGMKSKIEKLITQVNHPCIIRIANGYNFDNIKSLLLTNKGIGTQIIIK